MSLPKFLFGIILTTLVFAIWTYVATGSLATTVVESILCFILLQVGYFAYVLFIVYQDSQRPDAGGRSSAKTDPEREPRERDGFLAKIRYLSNYLGSRNP